MGNIAGTLAPASESTSPLSLRNHIQYILQFIADDIDSPQTDAEQVTKSRGEKAKPSPDSVAEVHAALRQAGGFNMDQMVSEYRALRASVVKLWGAQAIETTAQDIIDLTRFNEAIDQELTESISYYSSKVERSRNLFLGYPWSRSSQSDWCHEYVGRADRADWLAQRASEDVGLTDFLERNPCNGNPQSTARSHTRSIGIRFASYQEANGYVFCCTTIGR